MGIEMFAVYRDRTPQEPLRFCKIPAAVDDRSKKGQCIYRESSRKARPLRLSRLPQ